MHPPEHTPEEPRNLNVCAGGAWHTRVSFAHGGLSIHETRRDRAENAQRLQGALYRALPASLSKPETRSVEPRASPHGAPFIFSRCIPVIKLNGSSSCLACMASNCPTPELCPGEPSALRRVGNPWFPLPRRRTERPPPGPMPEGVNKTACFSLCNSKLLDMPRVLRESYLHSTRGRV